MEEGIIALTSLIQEWTNGQKGDKENMKWSMWYEKHYEMWSLREM